MRTRWRARSASSARRPGSRPRPWQALARVHLSNSVTDEVAYLYLATDLTHGPSSPEPSEALEVRWVPFEEALTMTFDGRIADAMSVLAIQRVALLRGRAALGQ